jgi:colanic acid biosynthesis glycosyl transferase WcaI
MKLVLITDRYAPEARAAAYLFCELAEGLARRGHDVTVLTRYPTRFVPAEGQRRLPATEPLNGVKVVRVASLFSSSWPVLRGLDQVAVSIRIGIHLLLSPGPAAVLVSSPPLPLTLAAIIKKKLHGTPYVIHLHDLYPQTAIDLGILRNRWMIGLMRWVERVAYRNSGKIIAAAPATLEILKAYPGLAEGHVTFVDNYVNLSHCSGADRGAAFRERLRVRNEFVILYAGLMGHAQDMKVILECARLCAHRPDWRFVLAGDGARSEEVRLAAGELSNVQFLGCLPTEEYFAALQACDVALVTLDPALTVPAVPGKVPTIMASGKPFVAAVPEGNDTRQVAARSEGGLIVKAGSPAELAEALAVLYEDPGLRKRMGAKGKVFAEEHCSLDGALVKFERALELVSRNTLPSRQVPIPETEL